MLLMIMIWYCVRYTKIDGAKGIWLDPENWMKHQTPNETYSGCLTEKIKKKLAHKAAIAMGKKDIGGFINGESASH